MARREGDQDAQQMIAGSYNSNERCSSEKKNRQPLFRTLDDPFGNFQQRLTAREWTRVGVGEKKKSLISIDRHLRRPKTSYEDENDHDNYEPRRERFLQYDFSSYVEKASTLSRPEGDTGWTT